MKSMRNLVGVVLAFALATFAIPGFAQGKSFFLGATSQISAGTAKTVVLTFKNNDAGNSSFNSVSATGTPGSAVTITAASTSSSKRGTVSGLNTNKVTITDLSPTKSGETLTVTLTVTATAGDCTSGSIAWVGSGWTGSPSTPSNPFTQLNSGVATTVTAAACSVTFTNGPTNAFVNQVIPVGVAVVKNGAAAVNGTSVTLTSQCVSGTFTADVSSLTATTVSGVATFSSLKSSTTATGCKLTATSGALSSVSGSFDVNGKLVFSPLPTSVVPGVPSTQDIIVKFVDANGAPIPGFAGKVNLEVAVVAGSNSTCTLPDPTFVTASGGVATFAALTFGGTPGACTIKVFATIDGKYYEQTSSAFKTYAGVLNCDANDPNATIAPLSTLTNQFDGSPGVNDISDVKYYKGARGSNDLTGGKTNPCVAVNYTTVNNVIGTGSDTTSQPGKSVPANGAALFWDEAVGPNATFRVVTTFRDEWTNGDGWVARRTKVCLDDACTETYPLKACLGTALVVASVPVYGSDAPSALIGQKMAGCVYAEVWSAVVPDASSACTPGTKPGPNSGCIRTTSELLIIRDPAWDR